MVTTSYIAGMIVSSVVLTWIRSHSHSRITQGVVVCINPFTSSQYMSRGLCIPTSKQQRRGQDEMGRRIE